ncbi:bacterial cell division membrane protein [Frankia casuarinae]|uniref:peptidoglycan glycosyltransferase n=2 Tax=Frankia casuarinae (strain DSM 45818 / CECT 9043 / HFP020203 / CcI3) TaxID=106370 RepID=Q2JDP9_FRACC|nr:MULTISPECIES: rod shape-determining protein RodA [Frankia]KDA43465.1 bacterial cell division membrane protein [Frankia sp. BMG5.23]KFB06145.1 rod shape-determining protein RodA [Frankia sp. Allo2]OFB43733.1 rod shape-determining protein RodA [Frankia sp. CgIM4]ABD10593.1 cell cycle protein [Frankia casuarinae]ETA02856.1 bacterial cell division membrane protein [Frankia sp. CcI6]
MVDEAGPTALRSSPVPIRGRIGHLRERASGPHSPLRRLDWPLQLCVIALSVLGALLVWSATRQRLSEAGSDPNTFLDRHLLNLAIGLVLGAVATVIDYRAVRAYAPFVYLGSLVGLVAVLLFGSTINGAHSWIVLPAGFQLQPSEFAKMALVVGAAMILGEKHEDRHTGVRRGAPGHGDVLLVLGLAVVPIGLIMLQPDFGTVMVLVFTTLGMLAVSGAPRRWVLGLILCGVLFGGAILQFHLLKPYQEARLTSFVSENKASSGTGYNVDQAMIAIANGGISGRGLLHGQQTQGQFVPEQQTDFVFSVAGEELGYLGGGGIIVLLGVVLWRALSIGFGSQDSFGALVATGVVSWFTFQAFVNIGMCLGIMPVTGLPLPFLSYGGSSMFANMIAVGLLQNVRLRSRSDPYAS